MAAFVLDTSIALKWFLEDETDRGYSLAILKSITDDYRPAVPFLWYYEIANTILTQVRRKRIVFEEAVAYLNIIDDMLIDVDPPNGSAILQLPHLARTHNLTGYDAAFLEWRCGSNCLWQPAIKRLFALLRKQECRSSEFRDFSRNGQVGDLPYSGQFRADGVIGTNR